MEGAISHVVTALLTTIANITTVVIAARYGFLGKKEETAGRQVEADSALESKKLDDAAAIRKELRDQVAEISNELRKLRVDHEQARVHITDLQIALRRFVSRIEECVGVIYQLLEAEEHIDQGHVRRARAILKLVENDKEMRRQILEEEQPEVLG